MKKTGLKLLTLASLAISALTVSVSNVNAQDKELLIYSNSFGNGRGEWIEEKATEAGFKLTYVDAGGGDTLNRLLAEKAAPQADLTFGLDEAMFFTLSNEDLLVDFEPTWAAEVPEEANIGNGKFYPLVEQRIFMVYNPEFVKEDQVPTNWQDLAENGELQYKVPDTMGGGTNQKAALSILLQYIDEAGELGISQEGWDQLAAYFENGYTTPEGEDSKANFADGKVPISFTYSSGIPAAEEEYGFKVEIVNPEQGVVTMREQIGIINKGADADYSVAQEFVDWFGSVEVQKEFATEFGSIPVLPGAQEGMNDRMKGIVETTTPMTIDWAFVNENLSAWIEKIELEILP